MSPSTSSGKPPARGLPAAPWQEQSQTRRRPRRCSWCKGITVALTLAVTSPGRTRGASLAAGIDHRTFSTARLGRRARLGARLSWGRSYEHSRETRIWRMGGARRRAGRDSLSLPHGYHESGAVAGCVRHQPSEGDVPRGRFSGKPGAWRGAATAEALERRVPCAFVGGSAVQPRWSAISRETGLRYSPLMRASTITTPSWSWSVSLIWSSSPGLLIL